LPYGFSVLMEAAAAVDDRELVEEAAAVVVQFDDIVLTRQLAGAGSVCVG